MRKRSILILGGARSGKSAYAQQIAEQISGRVIFVATAEALDMDMKARIEKHKAERPSEWKTLEASTGVSDALKGELADIDVVLLDCVTLLVSNIFLGQHRGMEEPSEAELADAEGAIVVEINALLQLMQNFEATFVIVSNEIGLGVVPENRLARLYRDLLGRANQLLAQNLEEVYLMVSGIPMKVK